MNKIFGYARVSTNDQILDSQLASLREYGIKDKDIFCDKSTGSNTNREQFQKMLSVLRNGDTVVVYRMDRLTRSLKDLIEIINGFNDKGIQFKSLKDEFVDTTSSNGKLVFHIFGAINEFYNNVLKERTKAGLEAARARGRKGGRKHTLDSKEVEKLKKLYADKKIEIKDLCKMFSLSRATIFRYVKE